MDKDEKMKLRIQKLQAQSDYQKFEYSQKSTYYIGLIASLIAIYIPITISVNKLCQKALVIFFLVFFFGLSI